MSLVNFIAELELGCIRSEVDFCVMLLKENFPSPVFIFFKGGLKQVEPVEPLQNSWTVLE